MRPFGVPHPAILNDVARQSLANELRTSLLSVSSRSTDPKIQELRKAIERRRNKAPDTIASLLTEAHNANRADPQSFASTIRDFFSAHGKKLQRTIRQLNPIETKLDGELNCIQMAIADGDHSTPTLKKFVEELDEYIEIAGEMRAAAVAELYGT
jgi:hypothetical protein